MMQEAPLSPIRVGSWPGPSFGWNPFVAHFCESLTQAGCTVIDVDDPRRLPQPIDILHIHWPEQIYWKGGGPHRLVCRAFSTLRAIAKLRRGGVRIVWMLHNLAPHDLSGTRRLLWPLIRRRLAALTDGFLTLSPATVPVVRAALPALADKPGIGAWHPAYPLRPPLPDRAECRREAGVEDADTLYAFLGMIRPYKGVEDLIAAFRADSRPHRRLLIAGHCGPDAFARAIQALAAGDPRIDLRLGTLDDARFAALTRAADVIVLPFRDYLHSGSMLHALSHGRPVLTPAAPFADALAREVGPGWVRTYEGPLRPETLDDAARPAGEPDLDALRFDILASAAHALYARLMAPSERPRT